MPAGDITKALTVKVRTALEETTAGFFLDAEIYTALADAQREIIGHLLAVFKVKQKMKIDEPCPTVLTPLLNSTVAAAGTQNLPTDYLDVLFIKDSTASNVQIKIRGMSSAYPAEMANTYLASTSAQPFCYINATQVVFETSLSWIMTYFKIPTDPSGSVDPTLNSMAHNAMVQYAFAFMLEKDHDERAGEEFNKFYQLLKDLYY